MQSNNPSEDHHDRDYMGDELPGAGDLDRLAVLAHELNNLLDGCLRCLSSARTEVARGSSASQADGLLETVHAGLMQMADLVAGATRSAAVSIGSTILAPNQRRTLGEVIAHAREIALASAGDRPIRIEVVCEEGIAELPAGSLYAVLLNGLRNAVEAVLATVQESDDAAVIELRGRTTGGVLDLRIIDPGNGLELDPDRALSPQASTKGPGRGVGLAVCREIIDRVGGTLELRDRTGHTRGAELRIALPVPKDEGSVWIGSSEDAHG